LRLTILHFAQRFFIDEETFMMTISCFPGSRRCIQPKARLYLIFTFSSSLTRLFHTAFSKTVDRSISIPVSETLRSQSTPPQGDILRLYESPGLFHGKVKISGSPSVIATECSK
jgi:hypothetical protein